MALHPTLLYQEWCRTHPGFRKATHRWLYEALARFIRHDRYFFMNYGYAFLEDAEEGSPPSLDPGDEPDRLTYQLYHHLAGAVDLRGKQVLEVGCGRGGGAALTMKYHGPERLVGLDCSASAVALCRRSHRADGLSFVEGDAEKLPFEDGAFDVVINVESSHCYGSMPRFLAEVRRVLKPGGVFLFADLRKASLMEGLRQAVRESGMTVLRERDITDHVIRALDEDTDHRLQEMAAAVPRPFIGFFKEFAGVRDSTPYLGFVRRDSVYFSYVMSA